MSFIYLPINIAVITQLNLVNQIAVLSHDIMQTAVPFNIDFLSQG